MMSETSEGPEGLCYLLTGPNGELATTKAGHLECIACCPDREQAELIAEESGGKLAIRPVSQEEMARWIKAAHEKIGVDRVLARRTPPRVVRFTVGDPWPERIDLRRVLAELEAEHPSLGPGAVDDSPAPGPEGRKPR
jgi:hypothetical protein